MDLLHIILNAVMAALAATGFAMLFNVPRRALPLSALCGAVGILCRNFLTSGVLSSPLHIAMATLCASLIVAFLAELLSRKMELPPNLFSVPGVIPMIPGGLMFRSVTYWLGLASQQQSYFDVVVFGEALSMAGTAMIVLSSIALGIAGPNLIFYRRRPEA